MHCYPGRNPSTYRTLEQQRKGKRKARNAPSTPRNDTNEPGIGNEGHTEEVEARSGERRANRTSVGPSDSSDPRPITAPTKRGGAGPRQSEPKRRRGGNRSGAPASTSKVSSTTHTPINDDSTVSSDKAGAGGVYSPGSSESEDSGESSGSESPSHSGSSQGDNECDGDERANSRMAVGGSGASDGAIAVHPPEG